MKLFKTLVIISFGLLFFTSCHKIIDASQIPPRELTIAENLANSARGLLLDSSNAYDNYVVLKITQLANKLNRDSAYSIDAFARFSTNGQNIDVGPVSINNNINMLADANNFYSYHFSINEGLALAGTSMPVDAAEPPTGGGGGESRLRNRTILVVPTQIFPSSINLPSSVVDRSVNFPLTWSPDPSNQFGKVQIDVCYYTSISQHNATGMPNSVASLSYQVLDNGNFIIPAAHLNRFPRDSYIGISISRVFSVISVNNVAYVAFASASTVPLLVVSNGPLVVDYLRTNGGTAGSTAVLNAIVNGGIPPFTYQWRRRRGVNYPWININATSPNISLSSTCPGRGVEPWDVELKVTDNLANSQSTTKQVALRCNP